MLRESFPSDTRMITLRQCLVVQGKVTPRHRLAHLSPRSTRSLIFAVSGGSERRIVIGGLSLIGTFGTLFGVVLCQRCSLAKTAIRTVILERPKRSAWTRTWLLPRAQSLSLSGFLFSRPLAAELPPRLVCFAR